MKRTSTRAGMTLIQLLVSILLTGVISTAAITAIITMLLTQSRSTQVWVGQHAMLRLSDDFRRDVHSATSAEIGRQNDRPTLILMSAEPGAKTVRYVATENEVTRQAHAGEQRIASESYALRGCELKFEISDLRSEISDLQSAISNLKSVRLTCNRPNIEPLTSKTPTPRHDEHIVAILGRDRRCEKSSTRADIGSGEN